MKTIHFVLGVLILVAGIAIWKGWPCLTGDCDGSGGGTTGGAESGSCVTLSINQQKGVGAFLSLSMAPLNSSIPPQVAPARIRAHKGEVITWVLRNPSDRGVSMELVRVRDPGATTDVKHEIFADLGGVVGVPSECGFGYLQATLRPDIVMPDSVRATCKRRVLWYDFMIRSTDGAHDSTLLKCLYDPEIIIEDQP